MASPAATDLDFVFSALADPTRRAIIERLLSAGELTAGEIARPFRISSPAISRHLRVLEQAGIIERRIDRQWRYVRIQPKALALADTWFAERRRHWTGALDRLETGVADQTSKEKKS
jgi:DNA-binding transcriptional ArsR family regulator